MKLNAKQLEIVRRIAAIMIKDDDDCVTEEDKDPWSDGHSKDYDLLQEVKANFSDVLIVPISDTEAIVMNDVNLSFGSYCWKTIITERIPTV